MIITPPTREQNYNNFSVFLAGTIDNGNSQDWQQHTANSLLDKFPKIDIYNPRRNSWNPDASSSELVEQIQWELHYLSWVDIVFFNFLPDSRSPVTMLELGLVLASGKACVVVNPSNFYRYDNVQQTSLAYGVLPSSDFDQGYLKLVDKIESELR